MNIADIIAAARNKGSKADTFVTVNGSSQEVFGIIGDSIANGAGEVVGPTPTAATVYEFNGTTIVQVSNDDLLNAAEGSPWPKFGVDYFAATGKKPVFSNSGSPSSEFFTNGDTNNWTTTGTLYAAFKVKLNAALVAASVTKPKGIFIILGINDIRGAQALASISTAINSLISRLNADYNTPEIYITIPGREETNINSNRRQYVVRHLINASVTYNNVHLVGSLLGAFTLGQYQFDNIHPTQAANNKLGEALSRYIVNTAGLVNKPARTICALFNDNVTNTKKLAIQAFASSFNANFFSVFDSFHMYINDTVENALTDWGLMGIPERVSTPTFTAKSHFQFNGSSNYLRSHTLQDDTTNNVPTDFIEFAVTKTVTTAAGTEAYLFGKTNSTVHTRLKQGSDSVYHFESYDATDSTDSTDTKFQNDTLYAIGRSGTAKKLRKGATELQSITQASTGGQTTRDTWIGAQNNNGAAGGFVNSGVKCWGVAKFSGITDMAAFVTNLNTLLTAMSV
jgi:lysophospholipase L1-like esterase